MHYFVGTSGWMYKDWSGRFYPKGMKAADQLSFYASHFSTVEVNSTFYHMPLRSSVQRWYDSTPDDFTFTIKLSRYLSHTKRLIPDSETLDTLQEFYERISPLKEKLAIILVQLPPSMHVSIERIEYLAKHSPFPLALECRHASWFEPTVFTILNKLKIATVINDSPGRWPATKHITGDTAYIRFHGSKWLYRSSYTKRELAGWADFIKKDCASAKRVFLYFNNDFHATAIKNASVLKNLLDRV